MFFFGLEKNGLHLPIKVNYSDPSISNGDAVAVRDMLSMYMLSPVLVVPEHSITIQLDSLISSAGREYGCRIDDDDQGDACATFRLALLGHLSYQFQRLVSRPEYIRYASGNPYAEKDVAHFVNVVDLAGQLWHRKYGTFRPDALAVAALYHDIDRVLPEDASDDPIVMTSRRMIDTRNIPDNEYGNIVKTIIHPENCAAIYRELSESVDFVNLGRFNSDVAHLITSHEIGGSAVEGIDCYEERWNMSDMANVLCEADGMSFFSVILPEYAKGRPPERVRAKVRFSMEKLSPEGRQIVLGFDYSDSELKRLVQETAGNN